MIVGACNCSFPPVLCDCRRALCPWIPARPRGLEGSDSSCIVKKADVTRSRWVVQQQQP